VAPQQVLEVLLREDVAGGLVLELGLPVESDGARGVALVVRLRVHVDFYESVGRVVALKVREMVLDPIRRDENVLRVR